MSHNTGLYSYMLYLYMSVFTYVVFIHATFTMLYLGMSIFIYVIYMCVTQCKRSYIFVNSMHKPGFFWFFLNYTMCLSYKYIHVCKQNFSGSSGCSVCMCACGYVSMYRKLSWYTCMDAFSCINACMHVFFADFILFLIIFDPSLVSVWNINIIEGSSLRHHRIHRGILLH